MRTTEIIRWIIWGYEKIIGMSGMISKTLYGVFLRNDCFASGVKTSFMLPVRYP